MRLFLASTAALVSMPAFAWLVAELTAYCEMFSTGTNSRAELGEDLGFGLLLFMVVPPLTLAGSIFVWWFVWSRTGEQKPTVIQTLFASKARASLSRLMNPMAKPHPPLNIEGERHDAVLLSDQDWPVNHETLHLLSVPSMRESIKVGMAEPIDTCAKKLDW